MQFVTRILATEPKLMADADAFRHAHEDRRVPVPAPVPAALRMAADVTSTLLDGRTVFTVTPKGERSSWHILYLHGGGYVTEMIGVHWEIILQLVRHTRATVTVPSYPLAPEHTHREGHLFVEHVYRDLLTRVAAEDIVLMGDSAGGGLALAQAMRYRDAGLPLPARLILFAPATSVVPNNPDAADVEPFDVILGLPGGTLAGQWWAGGDDPMIPQVSPLYGDPAGLPPVDIYQGTADILWPDARLMARRIREAGGVANLYEYRDAIHVFVGATFTPEAQDAYRRIAHTLGVESAPGERATHFVTSPGVVLGRQMTVRLRQRGTPWIQHLGARRLQLIQSAQRRRHASAS